MLGGASRIPLADDGGPTTPLGLVGSLVSLWGVTNSAAAPTCRSCSGAAESRRARGSVVRDDRPSPRSARCEGGVCCCFRPPTTRRLGWVPAPQALRAARWPGPRCVWPGQAPWSAATHRCGCARPPGVEGAAREFGRSPIGAPIGLLYRAPIGSLRGDLGRGGSRRPPKTSGGRDSGRH